MILGYRGIFTRQCSYFEGSSLLVHWQAVIRDDRGFDYPAHRGSVWPEEDEDGGLLEHPAGLGEVIGRLVLVYDETHSSAGVVVDPAQGGAQVVVEDVLAAREEHHVGRDVSSVVGGEAIQFLQDGPREHALGFLANVHRPPHDDPLPKLESMVEGEAAVEAGLDVVAQDDGLRVPLEEGTHVLWLDHTRL